MISPPKGFVEVSPSLFVRIQRTDSHATGTALWRRDGTTIVTRAQVSLKPLRQAIVQICRLAASGNSEHRKRARKLMRDKLGTKNDPKLAREVATIVGYFASPEVGAKGRWLKKMGKKLRKRINKAAGRLANNKIAQKLRNVYAKLLEGPAGKVAAGVASQILSMFGIPPQVSKTAIRAAQKRQADRARAGGWAGVTQRTTKDKRMLRNLFKDEGKRFLRGEKGAYKEQAGELKQALGGGLSSVIGGIDDEYFEDEYFADVLADLAIC